MRRLIELMIVVVIVGAGCSMTGRQLAAHYDSGPHLGNSGHHNLYYEHHIVEFDYKIDLSMNTITCDGVIGFARYIRASQSKACTSWQYSWILTA